MNIDDRLRQKARQENLVVPEEFSRRVEETLGQLSSRIHLYGNTKEQLIEHIKKVFETYDVVDENGESMLLPKHDVDEIRRRLDYSL